MVHITSLASGSSALTRDVVDVALLGSDGKTDWTRNSAGMHIRVGSPPSPVPAAVAFRIRLR